MSEHLTKEDAAAIKAALSSMEYAAEGVVSLSGTVGIRRWDGGGNPTTITVHVSWEEGAEPMFSTIPDWQPGLVMLASEDESEHLAQVAAVLARMDEGGRQRALAYLASRFGSAPQEQTP